MVGRGAQAIDDASVDAKAPAEQSRARGQAGAIGVVTVLETHAFSSDAVDTGNGVAMVALAAQMVSSQGVDVNVEHAHVLSPVMPGALVACHSVEAGYWPTALLPLLVAWRRWAFALVLCPAISSDGCSVHPRSLDNEATIKHPGALHTR